jgi:hypothetical protein
MVQIDNIRFGFATNSSSTHSLIYRCSNKGVARIHNGYGNSQTGGEYGWEYFLLDDVKDKMHYLALQIYYNCPENIPQEAKFAIIKSLIGFDMEAWIAQHKNPYHECGYIDHQSIWGFPKYHQGSRKTGLHKKYVKAVKRMLQDKDMSVCGGNDNSDVEDMPYRGLFEIREMRDFYCINSICREETDGWFTVFNPLSGDKTHINFNPMNTKPFSHSKCPELVDLSITDRCFNNCKFCYKGSNSKGKHASFAHIKRIINQLSKAEVFELVLGGGEPTLHPNFCEILTYAKSKGLSVSFTSYNTDWMDNKNIFDAVKDCCSSFAISSLNVNDLERIKNSTIYGKGKIHVPLGCYDKQTIINALEFSFSNNMDVTILGYKPCGRGEKFKPHDYEFIVKYMLSASNRRYVKFGVDTAFIAEFKDELLLSNVSSRLMVENEGTFSCYIDGVNKLVGASSYCPKSELSSYVFGKNKIDVLAKYPYIEAEDTSFVFEEVFESLHREYNYTTNKMMISSKPYDILELCSIVSKTKGKIFETCDVNKKDLRMAVGSLRFIYDKFKEEDVVGKSQLDMIMEAIETIEVEYFKAAMLT